MKNLELLTDKQLVKLLKIRLENDNNPIIPTKIKVESKKIDDNVYSVRYLVSSKKYATYYEYIVFNKFFPNEFLFLQKCGVKF